jgi:hypothetical protein
MCGQELKSASPQSVFLIVIDRLNQCFPRWEMAIERANPHTSLPGDVL